MINFVSTSQVARGSNFHDFPQPHREAARRFIDSQMLPSSLELQRPFPPPFTMLRTMTVSRVRPSATSASAARPLIFTVQRPLLKGVLRTTRCVSPIFPSSHRRGSAARHFLHASRSRKHALPPLLRHRLNPPRGLQSEGSGRSPIRAELCPPPDYTSCDLCFVLTEAILSAARLSVQPTRS